MTCNTYQFKPYCTCGLISNSRCLAVCRSTTPPYQSTSNAPDPTETTYFSSRHPSLTYVVKVHFKCVFLLLQHRSPITQARGQRTESSWEKKRIKNAVYVSWNSPPNSNAASLNSTSSRKTKGRPEAFSSSSPLVYSRNVAVAAYDSTHPGALEKPSGVGT